MFLVISQFFTSWDGRVVSVAPPPVEDPAVLTVRIVDADRAVTLQDWPAEVVRTLEVPYDRVAVPPPTIPETRPTTRKAAFALAFTVEVPTADGAPRVLELPTTSPRAVGIAALVFLALIAVRNMLWAGSPLALERRSVYLPPAQAQAGVPVKGPDGPPQAKRRGHKGPPPSRRGRRR